MFIFKAHNHFFDKIQAMVNAYDPYGYLRVNTLQSALVLSCLLMFNAIECLPRFNTILLIAIFGVWSINSIVGYNARIKGFVIFSAIIIPYALILGLVHNYSFMTIVIVGVVVFALFVVAKKCYLPLLGMIPLIQILDYTMLKIPVAGWANLLHWASVYLLASGLIICFLLLFPRIYFFRVWLRSLYLSIQEIENRLRFYEESVSTSPAIAVLKHVPRCMDFTSMLNYQEHGFSARRMALKLTSLSSASMALISKAAILEKNEIDALIKIFDTFLEGLTKTQPVSVISPLATSNRFYCELHRDLSYMMSVWNALCLKI